MNYLLFLHFAIALFVSLVWLTKVVLYQIGGSLVKLVYFSREVDSTDPGGRLNFQYFETDRIDDCIEFMKLLRDKHKALNGSRSQELCVMATGGGAYKFYDIIRDALEVEVLREDEMECLIVGKPKQLREKSSRGNWELTFDKQGSTSSSRKFLVRFLPTPKQTPCISSALERSYIHIFL